MLFRWVICPVVIASDGVRRAKVSTITDPGRPPASTFDDDGLLIVINKTYQHTSIISSGLVGEENTWCLCLVWGESMANLDLDVEVVNLLGKDFSTIAEARAILDLTPRSQGWGVSQVNKTASILQVEGVDTVGLTIDSTFEQWLLSTANTIHLNHKGVKGL